VVVPLLIMDLLLWSANVLKIVDSGWVPIVIAIVMCILMHTYRWGRAQEERVMTQESEMLAEELARTGRVDSLSDMCTVEALQVALKTSDFVRGDRAVVFLTSFEWRVPRTVGALASLLGYLPKAIVLLSVRFDELPFVPEGRRATFEALGAGVYSVVLHFGYAEPLTKEQFSIQKAVAAVVQEQCEAHPELRMFGAVVPADAAAPNEGHSIGGSSSSDHAAEDQLFAEAVEVLEAGGAADWQQQEAQHSNEGQHRTTFVLHKLHYVLQPDGGHGYLDRVRVALYRFIVVNARNSISFFGLEGPGTMEISVVRFL